MYSYALWEPGQDGHLLFYYFSSACSYLSFNWQQIIGKQIKLKANLYELRAELLLWKMLFLVFFFHE